MDANSLSLPSTSGKDRPLSLRVISEDLEFARMSAEWGELASECPDCDFFVSWDWLNAWWLEYGTDLDLRIYSIRDGEGQLLGILPTYLKRQRVLKFVDYYELRFIGTGMGPEAGYFDLIARPRDRARVTGAIIPSLLSESAVWDFLGLDNMPAESPLTRRLPKEMPGHIFEGERQRSAIVELPPTFSLYLDTLTTESQDLLRFARERFSFDGDMKYTCHETADELKSAIKQLSTLKAKVTRSRKNQIRDSLLRRLARKTDGTGKPRIHLISRGAETVAGLLTYIWRHTVYCVEFVCRSEENQDLKLVLGSKAIENAMSSDISRCDFLHANTQEAAVLAPQTRETVSLSAYRDGRRERLVQLGRRLGRR